MLVVEDDPLSGRTLAAILRHYGFEVELATSVDAALASLDRMPRCVFLDLMLPDGDGALILARIRAARSLARVAVISSVVDPERMEVLTRLGAQRCFRKPVNPQELIDWIGVETQILPQIPPVSDGTHNQPSQ